MTTISLSKALKLKSQLAGDYIALSNRIATNNSIIAGNNRRFNIEEGIENLKKLKANLIELKLKITQGNAGIMEDIITLAETKDLISQYQRINTTEGKVSNYNSTTPVEYVVHYTADDIINIVNDLKKQIIKLQDKIDMYNHTTTISLSFEIV